MAKPYCCRQSQGGNGQGAKYECKKTVQGCLVGPISPNACADSTADDPYVNEEPFPRIDPEVNQTEYEEAREQCDAKVVDPDEYPDYPGNETSGSYYTPVCCKLESGQGAKPFICVDSDFDINTVCPIKDVVLTKSPTNTPTTTDATPRPTNAPTKCCSSNDETSGKICAAACGGTCVWTPSAKTCETIDSIVE